MGSQHGEIEIILDGNIIIATLVGSFNEEGAIKYTESVKEIVKNLKGESYAILVDNSNLDGGTPEAYQVLEKYNQWLNSTNITAKAITVKDTITVDLIKSLSPSIQHQNIRKFIEKDLALKWLQSLMA